MLVCLIGVCVAVPIAAAPADAAPGVIEGTVFRDWNQNGVQDPGTAATAADPGVTLPEPGVAGVEVRAFDSAGNLEGPTTSDANGHYSLSLASLSAAVSSTFRVEFTIPASVSNLQPGPMPETATVGAVRNGTSVQFSPATGAVAPGAAGVDFGVADPSEYCQADPKVATACFVAGIDPSRGTIRAFDYLGATSQPVTDIATQGDTGAVWGLAWDRTRGLLYSASFAKRYAPYGPDGPGAIYATDPDSGTTSLLMTIPAGPDTHNPSSGWDNDDLWEEVGHVSFGDIDMADDDSTLYVVNLFDRKLYLVDPATATANPIDFPDPGTGATGCPLDPSTPAGELNRNLVPGGVKFHEGMVYAALTCTAENVSGGATPSMLRGFVYSFSFDGATFAEVANFSLNYPRAPGIQWQTWPPAQVFSRPQPWLTDIEFDDGGFMILGIADRLGHQSGRNFASVSAGDILRLSATGGTWTLENNGSDGTNTPVPVQQSNQNPPQGPGGGEFYFQDTIFGHADIAVGGLAYKTGRDEVLTSVIDAEDVFSGGVHYYSNSTGTNVYGLPFDSARQEVVVSFEPQRFSKATSLGDLELLCDAAPVQIGNRAWVDLDRDGIQDPEEPPLANVTVELVGGTTGSLTVLTGATGLYTFSVDARTPYTLRFDTSTVTAADLPSGYPTGPLVFTTADAGTDDAIDSDAPAGVSSGTVAVAAHAPGENDHTFDAGVVAGQLRLGNLVWDDLNDDGIVDAGEPGIPGVRVELYADTNGSGTFDPGIDALVTFTATSTAGLYYFGGLSAGTYFVAVPGGQPALGGARSSTGVFPGPTDNDDNGEPAGPFASVSGPVTLSLSAPSPLGETDVAGGDDEAEADAVTGDHADSTSDLTVDFGFFTPPTPKKPKDHGDAEMKPQKPPPATPIPKADPRTRLDRLLSKTGAEISDQVLIGGTLVSAGLWVLVGVRLRGSRRRLPPPAS